MPVSSTSSAESIVYAREADCQLSTGLHRIDAVGDQIEQRELELHGVGDDVGRLLGDRHLHLDARVFEHRAGHLAHASHQRAKVRALARGWTGGVTNRAPRGRSPVTFATCS